VKYAIEPMALGDIGEVLEVDRESYSLPWPASAYRRELGNRHAHYIVLRELDDESSPPSEPVEQSRTWKSLLPWYHLPSATQGRQRGRIIGYAGMWLTIDEAHITTIAVRRHLRGKGLGELLLASLVELAGKLGARWITLEVRITNRVAQNLYQKYGFHQSGLRRHYYSDNNEDAYIMTTDDITTAEYQTRFQALKEALARRLHDVEAIEASAPVLSGSSKE
jgi:ribosomal-protein-alanine N-acetyltransferase